MSEPNVNAIPATKSNVKTITSMAMLTAIAYVVMVLSKMLPQVSGFLQLDLKDTVICIGGFVFGPLAAAIISIVVAVVEMFTVSDTGIIGLIMNMLATCAFCCTAAFVYKRIHTKKGAIIGLALGVVLLTIVMMLWHYLITPLYMGVPRAMSERMPARLTWLRLQAARSARWRRESMKQRPMARNIVMRAKSVEIPAPVMPNSGNPPWP